MDLTVGGTITADKFTADSFESPQALVYPTIDSASPIELKATDLVKIVSSSENG